MPAACRIMMPHIERWRSNSPIARMLPWAKTSFGAPALRSPRILRRSASDSQLFEHRPELGEDHRPDRLLEALGAAVVRVEMLGERALGGLELFVGRRGPVSIPRPTWWPRPANDPDRRRPAFPWPPAWRSGPAHPVLRRASAPRPPNDPAPCALSRSSFTSANFFARTADDHPSKLAALASASSIRRASMPPA